MASGSVKVTGLREFQRDIKRFSKDVDKGLTKELKRAAEPVKTEARARSLANISHLSQTPRWAGMRVGVSRGAVFVVPSARRRGGSPRPNLGVLLLRQMEQAAEEKQDETRRNIEQWIDNLNDRYGF